MSDPIGIVAACCGCTVFAGGLAGVIYAIVDYVRKVNDEVRKECQRQSDELFETCYAENSSQSNSFSILLIFVIILVIYLFK